MMTRTVLFTTACSLFFSLATHLEVVAGGPLGADGTTPRTYSSSAFPLSYKTDLGGLGAFNNTEATAIANYAFQQWGNVTQAALSFNNAGTLPRNVTSATDALISGSGQFSDSINPVIFDSAGTITDARFGNGASNAILGFASSAFLPADPSTFTEGYVVINGVLSGSASLYDEERYKATITHEVGHFLGVAHSQLALYGNYPTMYPQMHQPTLQKTLSADDIAAIAGVYPKGNYPNTVGSISGTVKLSGGTELSGVSVAAINTTTNETYSTIVDYFSGGKGGFNNPPTADGSYTLSGLPAGSYYVRIEPVNPDFKSGSTVASYDPPVNTSVLSEWYNGVNESGDLLMDDVNEKTAVSVTAGSTTSNIDFTANESATVTPMQHYTNTDGGVFPIPYSPQTGTTFTRYATRFTAPSKGSLVGIRLHLGARSSLPVGGTMTVSVYTNGQGGTAGVPGTLLESITIPYAYLSIDNVNDIWLRGLGNKVNFNNGEDFQVVISTNGVGMLSILLDDGQQGVNRTSFYINETSAWRNVSQAFPDAYNLYMTALYSTVPAGVPLPAFSASPTLLEFDRKRPGESQDKMVTLKNTGTADLDVASVAITGNDKADFSIVGGGGGFTLEPDQERTVTVRFAPKSASVARKVAALVFTGNAPTSPNQLTMTGWGVEPKASQLVQSIDFGMVRAGTSKVVDTLVIRNTGNEVLAVDELVVSGNENIGDLTVEADAATVAPDDRLRLTLTYEPTKRGTMEGTVRIPHDGPSGGTDIAVTGQSVAPAFTADAEAIDFGGVSLNVAASSTFTIGNTGDAPMRLEGLELQGDDAALFSLLAPDQTPVMLPPGESVIVRVGFTPEEIRSYNATLRITHDAAAGSKDLPITGAGIAPIVSVERSLDAGSEVVGGEKDAPPLYLRNLGTAPLQVESLMIDGVNGADFSVRQPTTPFTVQAADSTAILLSFKPGAGGARAAELSILHNASASAISVQLRGTGLGAVLRSVAEVDFGRRNENGSYDTLIVVRNEGQTPLQSTALEISGELNGTAGGYFELVDDADFILSPGGEKEIGIRFRPVGGPGTYSGAVIIETKPGPAVLSIALKGEAVSGDAGVEDGPAVVGGLLISRPRVVPNPARDMLEVSIATAGNGRARARLTLVDVTGRVVAVPFEGMLQSGGERRFRVDISGLPSGEYLATFEASGRRWAVPFVIVR